MKITFIGLVCFTSNELIIDIITLCNQTAFSFKCDLNSFALEYFMYAGPQLACGAGGKCKLGFCGVR